MSNEQLPQKRFEEKTLDSISSRIGQMLSDASIRIPANYAWENELKLAWLKLQTIKDRNERPAIEVCTKESIINSFLEMTMKGLSISKSQGYFIVYSNQLTFQESYFGTLTALKRAVKLKYEPMAQVIYEGDVFEYGINPENGQKRIIKHEQSLENIDDNKIKGAYAIVVTEDGTSYMDVMSMQQIRLAWNQGTMKGNSKAHNNFTGEMAKKTVLGRVAKIPLKTSEDGHLYDDDEKLTRLQSADTGLLEEVILDKKKEVISFDDSVVDTSTGEIYEAPKQVEAPRPEPLKAVKKQVDYTPKPVRTDIKSEEEDPEAPF